MSVDNIKRFFEVTNHHSFFGAVGLTLDYLNYNMPSWVIHQYWNFCSTPKYELKIINAEVDHITQTGRFPFPVGGKNAIVGVGKGTWDQFTMKFTNTQFYRSMEMRYIDGEPWEHTPQYQMAKKKIKNGEDGWGVWGSINGLQRRCATIDRVYESIKCDGYKSKIDDEWNASIRNNPIPDEIRLAVDRNGKFIRIVSGRHRLAISKILGLNTVPAIVQIEHEKSKNNPHMSAELDIIDSIPIR